MIVITLMGGLGNQMFEYATALSLAKKCHTDLNMDLSWFNSIDEKDTKRWYELDCFALPQATVELSNFALVDVLAGRRVRYPQYVKSILKKRLWRFSTPVSGYDDRVLELPNNTNLVGWFQSERYFVNIRSELLKAFEYKKPPSTKNKQLLEKITAANSVSLHVRRGDYVTNAHAQKFHGLTGLAYYKTAISKIEKVVDHPTFFVFSDDPQWCQQNIKTNHPTIYVNHNKNGSEDMRLMRACQHNIIANSSFSWWGAWLNETPKKIVIAPKKWFNDETANPKDILPKSWQSL